MNPFSLGFLYIALLMLFGVGVSDVPAIVKIYFFAINLATIVAYFVDKGRAIRDERRIPEAVLHGMCLLGGAPGAELGRRFARHKTLKLSFRMVIILGMMEIVLICVFTNGHSVPASPAVAAQNRNAATASPVHHHKTAVHHEQQD